MEERHTLTFTQNPLDKARNYLKNNDFWGNTLVIFTSDHGEQIGDHWLLGKLGYFDESYHIPLIIRDPTNPQSNGRIIEEFTENVDVMPTILDWVDLPLPVQCDGRSLSPFLKNQKTIMKILYLF